MPSFASEKVIGLLGYNFEKKTTAQYRLTFSNETYQKNSLFKVKNWQLESIPLKGKFEKLFHIKDSIKSVKLLDAGEIGDGLLVQTEQEVLFVTEKAI